MFQLPEIAGKYQGRSVAVCGDAAGVWDDLEALGARSDVGRGKVRKEGWDFLTVNKLGEVFPGDIEHWYSNEGKLLQKFIEGRRNEYRKEFTGPRHSHSCNRGAKWHWPWSGHGTSGLGAVLTALALGYDEVVMCGIPLDDGPHNGEPHWRHCRFQSSEAADQVNGRPSQPWLKAIRLGFDGRVRSMSGRTKAWIEQYG